MRSWTNTDGNTLDASLDSLEGTTGTFRKADGQTFPYDIEKLSGEDRAVITEAQKNAAGD